MGQLYLAGSSGSLPGGNLLPRGQSRLKKTVETVWHAQGVAVPSLKRGVNKNGSSGCAPRFGKDFPEASCGSVLPACEDKIILSPLYHHHFHPTVRAAQQRRLANY
jgi:hypothetical protein